MYSKNKNFISNGADQRTISILKDTYENACNASFGLCKNEMAYLTDIDEIIIGDGETATKDLPFASVDEIKRVIKEGFIVCLGRR